MRNSKRSSPWRSYYRAIALMLPFATSAVLQPSSASTFAKGTLRSTRQLLTTTNWHPSNRQKRWSDSGDESLLTSVSCRGGSSSGNYDSSSPPHGDYGSGYDRNTNVSPQHQPNYPNMDDPSYFEEPPVTLSAAEAAAETEGPHETVQERLDQWRTVQQENSAAMQESPRDAQGRMKLLTSVGKGSRAAIFFFLMWRDMHLYETASAAFTSRLPRLFVTVPLMILFLTNMAGAIISLTSPSLATKKRLKAVLNLDKFVEVLLLLYSVIRLSLWPNRYTAREVYIGNCFHSAFFLLQCQAFTRLSWDENSAQPMSTYIQPTEATVTRTGIGSATGQIPMAGSGPQQNERFMPPPQRLGDEWENTSPLGPPGMYNSQPRQ